MSPHHGDDEMHDEDAAPGAGARTDEEIDVRERDAGGGKDALARGVPARSAERDAHPQRDEGAANEPDEAARDRELAESGTERPEDDDADPA